MWPRQMDILYSTVHIRAAFATRVALAAGTAMEADVAPIGV